MPPVDDSVKAPYAEFPTLCTDLVTTTVRPVLFSGLNSFKEKFNLFIFVCQNFIMVSRNVSQSIPSVNEF